jgi:DNA/RNA-binding domain of Phe-tRNA-synthetase-like protein
MIQVTENWQTSHPAAALGALSMRIEGDPQYASLRIDQVTALEEQLRQRYANMNRNELLELPQFAAYAAYYKRYKKTYHLLLQLESIAQKNKSIPRATPLVQAMFMAELNSLLLTAGHDLDQIHDPIWLDSSSGDEVYTLLSNEKVTCKRGDMVTRDSLGVFCSIIYGQDFRTRITNNTRNVLYIVYIPPGIERELIEAHLQELENNVVQFYGKTITNFREIFFATPKGEVW